MKRLSQKTGSPCGSGLQTTKFGLWRALPQEKKQFCETLLKHPPLICVVCACTLLLSACSKPPAPTPGEQAAAAVASSTALFEASLEAGHAWTPTRVQLDAAVAALAAEDFAAATTHANRAAALANASLAQAKAEESAWAARFPASPSADQ